MRTHWETIHTDTLDGFDIVVSVAPEEDNPRGYFDDDGETAQAIADGVFDWFMVRVEAHKAGAVLASDYLGGCCYESPMAFVRANDYYADMVQNVIIDARETIRKINA
jgi:hypothetical protein